MMLALLPALLAAPLGRPQLPARRALARGLALLALAVVLLGLAIAAVIIAGVDPPEVGMGSFATVAVCLAAKSLRVPIVLHEANAVLGKANGFLSRFAEILAFSLPLNEFRRCHCKQVHTGMPVRPELIAAAEETGAARPSCGPRNLLVFGGATLKAFLARSILTAFHTRHVNFLSHQAHFGGATNLFIVKNRYRA